MAAPAGYRTWATADEVSATAFSTYVQDQVVGVYTSSSNRSSELASPAEGQMSVTIDDNVVAVHDGSAWVNLLDYDTWSVSSGNYTIKGGGLTVGEDGDSDDVKFYGTTASTGYLLWDKSQNDLIIGPAGSLGLGATSPSYPLHISTTDNRPIGIVSSAAGSYLDMRDTATTGEGYVSVGAVGNELRFIAGGSNRMTIDSSGQVGIGTTSPAAPLQVNTTASDAATLILNTTHASSKRCRLQFAYGGTLGWEWGTDTTSGGITDMYAYNRASGTVVMTMLDNGNVGIGTTAPNNSVAVGIATASPVPNVLKGLDIQYGTETKGGVQLNPSTGEVRMGALNSTGDYFVTLYADNSEAMRIAANSRVAVGSTTTAAQLYVYTGTSWDSTDYALRVDNAETENSYGNGIQVQAGPGNGSSYPLFLWDNSSGACFYVRDDARAHFYGTVSKAGGSFDIPHPTKGGDWRLRHSFIEGPQADNLYRGTVTLTGGTATVDLDAVSNMTDGTWEALNRDPWALVASSGNAVEWSLAGKTLTITSDTADAVCSWMVIGERQDDFMKSSQGVYADDDGHLIVEYEETQPPAPEPPSDPESEEAEEAAA